MRRSASQFDAMGPAITIWLCTLPLVQLLVIPFFGLKIGLVVALTLFIAAMVICWRVFVWKVFRD